MKRFAMRSKVLFPRMDDAFEDLNLDGKNTQAHHTATRWKWLVVPDFVDATLTPPEKRPKTA